MLGTGRDWVRSGQGGEKAGREGVCWMERIDSKDMTGQEGAGRGRKGREGVRRHADCDDDLVGAMQVMRGEAARTGRKGAERGGKGQGVSYSPSLISLTSSRPLRHPARAHRPSASVISCPRDPLTHFFSLSFVSPVCMRDVLAALRSTQSSAPRP